MGPIQIVLIVLVCAGIWAVSEVALTIRRARATISSIDRTVEEITDVIEEVHPLMRRLDTTVEALQPALGQIEPLIRSANMATEALSADLIEVEAIVRDVSAVSGAAANASSAVSGITVSASDAVHRFFDRRSGSSKGRSGSACLHDGRALKHCCDSSMRSSSTTPKHMAQRRYYTYREAAHPDFPYFEEISVGHDKENSYEL
ncbi:hypothetical protein Corgl_1006 [Coriobacterium glomerans PW2]|uniref:DUF948 domain-containing protein n=1 Tax=Coriobacterium glomerans (strain ATCC 49209 / DSM 20642 / JCM 10262 / PW2) TaxID=700015 RepID=F2N805_CORGP|nr:DUF948 domain-containing protein [Coriobacterium glomerans]AEB07114.1 hypothetical protein Corgl_1006 [Coriobacterium glomerans PW2]